MIHVHVEAAKNIKNAAERMHSRYRIKREQQRKMCAK